MRARRTLSRCASSRSAPGGGSCKCRWSARTGASPSSTSSTRRSTSTATSSGCGCAASACGRFVPPCPRALMRPPSRSRRRSSHVTWSGVPHRPTWSSATVPPPRSSGARPTSRGTRRCSSSCADIPGASGRSTPPPPCSRQAGRCAAGSCSWPRSSRPPPRRIDPDVVSSDRHRRDRRGVPSTRRDPPAADRPPTPVMTDVIVVGSGPGGVNAAAPLVAAGCRVLMLDYGNRDTRYADLVPRRPFAELRRTDPNQHRYFLGDAFEGVPVGPVRVGAQLTPPRMHILADAAARMPVDAPGFAVSMSLARGGLGAGWSAGVFPFSDDELRDTSLGLADLQRHYDAVAERIGVAGAHDDLEPFLPPSPSMMPPLEIDSNAEVVLERYRRRRAALNARGFFLGRPRVAACTRPCRGRGPYPYFDLDYWADVDRSIYRPQWTLEELERSPNFTYLDRRFVLRL